jgi:hypothetical protein
MINSSHIDHLLKSSNNEAPLQVVDYLRLFSKESGWGPWMQSLLLQAARAVWIANRSKAQYGVRQMYRLLAGPIPEAKHFLYSLPDGEDKKQLIRFFSPRDVPFYWNEVAKPAVHKLEPFVGVPER